jgi:hypothetical protein
MLRFQAQSRDRMRGGGIADIALKVGKFLLPMLSKALEPIGHAIGSKVGKFIKGEGIQGMTAHNNELSHRGAGSRLAWEKGSGKKKPQMWAF